MRFQLRVLITLTVVTLSAMIAATSAVAQTERTPARAQAGGSIRVVPSSISIADGLGGSEVFRPLQFTNTASPGQPFRLAVEGEIAPWVSFVDPDDREVELDEITDDGSGVTVLVRIRIPENAPVGPSEAIITAVLAGIAQDSEESPVGLGLAVPVQVNVTGELVVAGTLLSVNVENTEVGVPVRGSIVIRNDGNTIVTPEVSLEVLKGSTSVFRTSQSGSELFPNESDEIEAIWDTASATPGDDYRAIVSAAIEGTDLGSEEVAFELLESGTLLREVVFTSLELANEPILGGLVRIEAETANPGQAEVAAVFLGELLREGEVVEQMRSLEYTVRPSDSVVVPITLDVNEAGHYTFSGFFTFEGGATESRQVSFAVVAAGDAAASADEATPDEGSTTSVLPWIAAGLLGLIVLALLVALFSRRARKSPSSAGTTAAEPTEEPAGESAR